MNKHSLMFGRRSTYAPPLFWKGLSTVTLFDAGVEELPGGDVRVPYRWPDGSVHNWKIFPKSGQPKCRWQHTGREVIPLGLDLLPLGFALGTVTIFLAEGEGDCFALRDRYVVDRDGDPIIVVGVPGASLWRRAWAGYLLPARRVYVLGDGDSAGRRLTDAILSDISYARPVLMPPGEDARSILQGETPELLDELLDQADRVHHHGRRMGLYTEGRWAA